MFCDFKWAPVNLCVSRFTPMHLNAPQHWLQVQPVSPKDSKSALVIPRAPPCASSLHAASDTLLHQPDGPSLCGYGSMTKTVYLNPSHPTIRTSDSPGSQTSLGDLTYLHPLCSIRSTIGLSSSCLWTSSPLNPPPAQPSVMSFTWCLIHAFLKVPKVAVGWEINVSYSPITFLWTVPKWPLYSLCSIGKPWPGQTALGKRWPCDQEHCSFVWFSSKEC